MSKQEYNEKRDEKDEKEVSKQQEKSAEEKWRRDPLGSIIWASILIWAGIVMLAANLGVFDLLTDFFDGLPFGIGDSPFEISFIPLGGWTVFWVGTAGILLLEVIIRLLAPEYRKPILGTLILSIVFLGIGLGTWACVLPLILIGVGISLLFRSLGKVE
jgi:hypothetical protein